MNRRQIVFGSTAMLAAAALPPVAVPMPAIITAIDCGRHHSITAAFQVFWDAKAEIIRVTHIPIEELYAKENHEQG